MTTLILHLGGYDLKGIYSLEEYYATNLQAYYDAIARGASHNYYLGRADAEITEWLEYFVEGMAVAVEKIITRLTEAKIAGQADHSAVLRRLDHKQRRALALFQEFEIITARQVWTLFGFKPRTSSQLCQRWTEAAFLEIVDSSNKARKYRLARAYSKLL